MAPHFPSADTPQPIPTLRASRLANWPSNQRINPSRPPILRSSGPLVLPLISLDPPPALPLMHLLAGNKGEVAEWSIALHWKCSVPQGTEGSNPSLSASWN